MAKLLTYGHASKFLSIFDKTRNICFSSLFANRSHQVSNPYSSLISLSNICLYSVLCSQRLPKTYFVDPSLNVHRQFTCGNIRFASHFYNVLGVNQSASQGDIKSAYYKMSKMHHPDISKDPNSHKRFTEISEAYETLGDAGKRREYDQRFTSSNSTSYNQSGFGGSEDYYYQHSEDFYPGGHYHDEDVHYYSGNNNSAKGEKTDYKSAHYHWNPFTKSTDNPFRNNYWNYKTDIEDDFEAWYKEQEKEYINLTKKAKKAKNKYTSKPKDTKSNRHAKHTNKSSTDDKQYEYILFNDDGSYEYVSKTDYSKKCRDSDHYEYTTVDELGNFEKVTMGGISNKEKRKSQKKKQRKQNNRSSNFENENSFGNYTEKKPRKPRDSDSDSKHKLYAQLLKEHERLKKKIEQYEEGHYHNPSKRNENISKAFSESTRDLHSEDTFSDDDVNYYQYHHDIYDKNRPNVSSKHTKEQSFEQYVSHSMRKSFDNEKKKSRSSIDSMERRLRNNDFFSMPKKSSKGKK